MMPKELEAPKAQQRHQVAHMQAVRGGIEARIDRNRFSLQFLRENELLVQV